MTWGRVQGQEWAVQCRGAPIGCSELAPPAAAHARAPRAAQTHLQFTLQVVRNAVVGLERGPGTVLLVQHRRQDVAERQELARRSRQRLLTLHALHRRHGALLVWIYTHIWAPGAAWGRGVAACRTCLLPHCCRLRVGPGLGAGQNSKHLRNGPRPPPNDLRHSLSLRAANPQAARALAGADT